MLRQTLTRWRLPVPVTRRVDNFPHYELCVIGGGPAGIAAAMRAATIGRKVCIIEAGQLGGRDIWNGTLQSKTLWEMGRFVAKATTVPGYVESILDPTVVPAIKASIRPDRIAAALQSISEQRERGVRRKIAQCGIDVIRGRATFNSESEVDVKSHETGEYRGLTADYFIIATGSVPRDHPLQAADHKFILSSDDIFKQPVPRSLAVVGGGPMGCEFASMYASLGLTKVCLIDRAPRILPKEDADVAASVEDSLARRGVTVHQGCQLFELETYEDEDGTGGVQYSVQNTRDGRIETNIVDRVLVTIGRMPNFRGLGLENTRIRVTNGHILMDEYNRCLPYKHIYCLGDAGNDRKLVNMAQASARAAVQHMYGLTPQTVVSSKTVNNISTSMFLDEEVACVGLNEKQCRERQIGYLVSKYDHVFLARAQVAGETHGFVKLIVTNDRQKRVLGVRAIGSHAGSVVETASFAIRNKQSVYDLLQLEASYPSMALGLIECARMLVGRGSFATLSKLGDDPDDATGVTAWRPAGCERGRAYY